MKTINLFIDKNGKSKFIYSNDTVLVLTTYYIDIELIAISIYDRQFNGYIYYKNFNKDYDKIIKHQSLKSIDLSEQIKSISNVNNYKIFILPNFNPCVIFETKYYNIRYEKKINFKQRYIKKSISELQHLFEKDIDDISNTIKQFDSLNSNNLQTIISTLSYTHSRSYDINDKIYINDINISDLFKIYKNYDFNENKIYDYEDIYNELLKLNTALIKSNFPNKKFKCKGLTINIKPTVGITIGISSKYAYYSIWSPDNLKKYLFYNKILEIIKDESEKLLINSGQN